MTKIPLILLPLFVTTVLIGPANQTQRIPKQSLAASAADVSHPGPSVARSRNRKSVSKPAPNAKSSQTTLKKWSAPLRGVYLTHDTFMKRGDTYLRDLQTRGVNTLVVDIKSDAGYVYLGASTRQQMQHVKHLGFYTIARVVAFKDPTACAVHPGWVMLRSRDWLNPANSEVQQYNLGIARRAAGLGIDEVQWDYVRYPDARISYSFGHRPQTIARFLATSRSQLHQQHVRVSADVFGFVTTAGDDMGIGQVWESLSPSVDTLSPMVYPSHYGRGHYSLRSPVHAPAALIRGAMTDAKRRNQALTKKGIRTASIRPWLQDFDYKASYGPAEIRAQIGACQQLGVLSYLFWNAGNVYTPNVSLR